MYSIIDLQVMFVRIPEINCHYNLWQKTAHKNFIQQTRLQIVAIVHANQIEKKYMKKVVTFSGELKGRADGTAHA